MGRRGEERGRSKGVARRSICEFFEGGIRCGEKNCIGHAREECECVLCSVFDGSMERERGRGRGDMGAGGEVDRIWKRVDGGENWVVSGRGGRMGGREDRSIRKEIRGSGWGIIGKSGRGACGALYAVLLVC